jgi:DNA-binding NarL/FixJ family response regulator
MLGRLDPIVVAGLAVCLRAEASLHLIGENLGHRELSEIAGAEHPGVAIIDEVSARVLLRPLQRSTPRTAVVVLARRPTLQYGLVLFAMGASCIAQNASMDDARNVVLAAGAGRHQFIGIDGHTTKLADLSAGELLTTREIAVLRFVSDGFSYGHIAAELEISVETVRKHTVRLREKLRVNRRKDLLGLSVPE